jgi:chaperonin cofactor prefoldin
LKAERLQKSNHRLELEIDELDKKIKNVEEKFQASQVELEELTSGLDDV